MGRFVCLKFFNSYILILKINKLFIDFFNKLKQEGLIIMTKMTTEEAFVKVLQMHGIEHAFGIIGSAFMPISDIFPDAGITFWDVAHETNGGLIADGYTRATGKMSMVIAQNGPGITGLSYTY